MHLVVCPHCWRQLRFRSSGGLVVSARMTCRYCGATFAAKVLEWQDDAPMPTAHEVYPHLSAPAAVSTEEAVEISVTRQVIDFRPAAETSQPDRQPQMAARAAGSDTDEDVEITAQPRIAPRPIDDETPLDETHREVPADPETPEEPEHCVDSDVSEILDEAAEITSEEEPPAHEQECTECASAPQEIAFQKAGGSGVEFPTFVKTPKEGPQQQESRQVIVETAASSEHLEKDDFNPIAEEFLTAKLIIEEEELLSRVEANDRQITKFNHKIYVCAVLAAIALAVIVGLLWLILLGSKSHKSKGAISDLNAAIRNDVESRFDGSEQPVLPDEIDAENAIEGMVHAKEPVDVSQQVAMIQQAASPVSAAQTVATDGEKKSPTLQVLPTQLDSSRVEMTIVNADGKLLRLTSRAYPSIKSGGDMLFNVVQIADSPQDAVAPKSLSAVDPLAMKILSVSRWGGLLGASLSCESQSGLIYVWCEFYDTNGLRAGAARGVLDANAVALQPGGAAYFRIFFQPALSHSSTVPDEVIFQNVSGGQNVAMTCGKDAVAVGMPRLFK